MKRIIFLFLLLLTGSINAGAQTDSNQFLHIGLSYPLSSNGHHAGRYANQFSFHLIHGESRAEQAFCFTGISAHVRNDVHGFLFSGIGHYAGGAGAGFLGAGVVNIVRGGIRGMQGAGICCRAQQLEGVQAAGCCSIVRDSVHGVQVAGLCAMAGHAGSQFSGFSNTAGSTDGVQAAGFVNVSGPVRGVQLAGFINIGGDVAGSQAAGFLNIAKKVKGVQVSGLINIADSSEYPIGLINLIRQGERMAGLSIDETGTLTAAFRSGSKKLYGIVGVGYQAGNERLRYALEAGLGAHFPVGIGFRLNTEAVVQTFTDFEHGACVRSSIRMFPSVRLGRNIEVYAGPSFTYSSYLNYSGEEFDVRYLWSRRSRNYVQAMNIGLTGGVLLHL